ncbi:MULTISPECIES: FmdB family zinc ribbon protein [unclassified Streptomyces]|uniref:FmdB family zinc ribbon protein n=1 Tax=unclassified Streptomyces TaxID=2593676 RepID=UPI00093E9E55|nr:FmdB family zinc ribbon protein [Streptomyces sp. CB02058]OKI87408.1 FmdB family transcriptional regulator [Streptomyces sp. CB02058]
MPTYQYQCTECGEGLEAVQKFTDDALTVCPNCEGRLKKVFSAVGIVFKGSGFYRNDSRGSSSSSTPATSSSSKTSDSSTGSSASKPESKPAASASTSSSASSTSSSGTSAA